MDSGKIGHPNYYQLAKELALENKILKKLLQAEWEMATKEFFEQISEPQAAPSAPQIDNRYVAKGSEKFGDANYLTSLQTLLDRALPLLEKLGDYIGNGHVNKNRKKSLGERYDLVLDIKNALKPIK